MNRYMLGICLNYQQLNYGSKLQAMATVKYLQELGLDYEIIRYKKGLKFYLKALPRIFNPVFFNDRYEQIQKRLGCKRHPEILASVETRNQAMSSFDVHCTCSLSERFESYEQLKAQCAQKYDHVLTCSDQLWSPSALGSGFYNLMFAPEEMRKVSWASSFGVSQIPWYQIKRTREYLQRIEHVSMRENRGAEIVKELTGREVPVLMDPVFVFDKEEWMKLVPYREPEWESYIFCYFLGSNPEHRAAARKLAEKTGKKIVTLRHLDQYIKEDEHFGDYAPYDVDPVRFLNIIRNADCVCTDSFHGLAFSVLCEKKFLVFNRYSDTSSHSKNSRIESVCRNLQLEDRRYFGDRDILAAMDAQINYRDVRALVQGYREKTKAYLQAALL